MDVSAQSSDTVLSQSSLPDPSKARQRLAGQGVSAAPEALDPGPRALWEVTQSARGLLWRLTDVPLSDIQALTRTHDLPEMVARLLAARGIGPDNAALYLDPTLRALMPDPSTLCDMDRAAEAVAEAIVQGRSLGVFADYDVDGATSSALLLRFLRSLNRDARLHVPDRIDEGYGPNGPAMRALAGDGVELLITVDCGMTAFEALDEAADAGLEVVVVDHHQPGDGLPKARAVVNPNREDDTSGLGTLAAVGVTFLLVVAITRALRQRGWFEEAGVPEPDLRRWLDLVALGTVCDVVPLVGLNRAFVVQGLKVMERGGNTGLAALAQVAGLTDPPGCYHLGFVLGPRINAGGRVGKADLGARLLTEEDWDAAAALARELDGLNQERREIEQAVLDAAVAQAEALIEAWPNRPVLMVSGEGWHPGVIGIVASRLKDRYERPAFVLAVDGMEAKGSARSVKGVDLGVAVLQAKADGLLIAGGGHAMAAGVTVATERIGDVEAFLTRALEADMAGARAEIALTIDATVSLAGATRELYDRVERAGPFGSGNPEPLVAIRDALVQWVSEVGDGHLRCTLATPEGAKLSAIAFRARDTELGRLLQEAQGATLHVAGRLRADNWKGRNGVQLHIEDLARAS